MTVRTREIPVPRPTERSPGYSRWLALAVLCISLLIVTLDNTVLNVVLPTLVRDLNATSTQLQWIVDSYVMVFAGLLLVAGSVADRIGRKRTFLAGLVLFAAGSTWAAFSGSVGMLIAARASMGIGAALIMPSTLSIITHMFAEPGERQRAIGFWAGTSGLGLALGPIIGGVLLAHFWWGSVFLINVPIAIAGLALAIPLVPDSKNPAAAAPDVTGAMLSVAGLGLLLWSIIEAPVRGWTSALVIGAGRGRPGNPGRVHRLGAPQHASDAQSSVLPQARVLSRDLLDRPGDAGLVRCAFRADPVPAVRPGLHAAASRPAGTASCGCHSRGGPALRAAGAHHRHQVHRGRWPVHHRGGTVADLPGHDQFYLSQHGGRHGDARHRGRPCHPGLDGLSYGLRAGRAHRHRIAATNGAVLQVGGALGVAIIGSLLATRYSGRMTTALAPYHVPVPVLNTILGSVGGALEVAARVGGTTGHLLAHVARSAFISGADLGLLTAAAVALAGCVSALAVLPASPSADAGPAAGARAARRPARDDHETDTPA